MDRRSFLSALPFGVAAAGPVAPEAMGMILRPPAEVVLDRRAAVHKIFMDTYAVSLHSPILDVPPITVVTPAGSWKVKWTGYKPCHMTIDLTTQWVAGFMGDSLGSPSCKITGQLVYVSNPGYGGILRRGEAMNIHCHSHIPWATILDTEEERRRIQGFTLDVLLDMIWNSKWGTYEEKWSSGKRNIEEAWPKLRPATKFYLDSRFLYEQRYEQRSKITGDPDFEYEAWSLAASKLFGYRKDSVEAGA